MDLLEKKKEIENSIALKLQNIGQNQNPVEGMRMYLALLKEIADIYETGYNKGFEEGQKVLGKNVEKN